ncbi:hypothetical protein [Gelatiniphilus marinus]|uniref:Uncharacterized protein n=1 Tax=Gelatiniphilus marinus TaxID=1759464 RepID=A0ABW5JTN9_9FLAO
MKKSHFFLLFQFLGILSFAQETEKLPEMPWVDIVEMSSNRFTPITKWGTDIKIGLEGNYLTSESISSLEKKLPDHFFARSKRGNY